MGDQAPITPESPAPPTVSPDGRFFLQDGKWIPLPGSEAPAGAAPAPRPAGAPKVHAVTHAAGWRYWFWGLLALGIVAFIGCNLLSSHPG